MLVLDEFKVTLEKLKGRIVQDLSVTDNAVVIKFTDNTFLDVYLDKHSQKLKTSTNKLES